MNILQISVHDHGGAAYYLAEAIRTTTKHSAQAVRQARGSYIQYPVDLVAEKPDDLVGVWEWADVVHVHDICPKLPRGLKSKPTVVTYHGSMYRRGPQTYNDLCQKSGWIGTVATIDLTVHGLPWLPDTRPDLSKYVDRSGRFIVAHAPTSRTVKDTDQVIEILDGAGLALDVIERVNNETCLRRKGRASVYVDQFRLCYGLNAIEAWQMGIPAIADASAETIQRILKEMGFLPFVRCGLDNLLETVLRLRDNVQFYNDGVRRGQQAIEEFHVPAIVAQRALAFYEQAQALKASSLLPLAAATEMRQGAVPAVPKPQPQGKKPKPKVEAEDLGTEGLVLVRYIGGNLGGMTITGTETHTRYEFATHGSARYMDTRDAGILLEWDRGNKHKSGNKRGKRNFEVVKR